MTSYIAAAMKILAKDSKDDTDHEDTPTPSTNFYSAAISRFPIFWSPYFFQWRNEPKTTRNLIKK